MLPPPPATDAEVLLAELIARGATMEEVARLRDPESNTPDEALEALKCGNQRFYVGAPKRVFTDVNQRRSQIMRQTPFAVVLGCSDSRVPIEIVFDQGPGDIFSIRVAGNVVDGSSLGSVQYAVNHLKVYLILVLGHEGCGAVEAAMQDAATREAEPQATRDLLALIAPALNRVPAHPRRQSPNARGRRAERDEPKNRARKRRNHRGSHRRRASQSRRRLLRNLQWRRRFFGVDSPAHASRFSRHSPFSATPVLGCNARAKGCSPIRIRPPSATTPLTKPLMLSRSRTKTSKYHSCLDDVRANRVIHGLQHLGQTIESGPFQISFIEVFENLPDDGPNVMTLIEVVGVRVLHMGDCGHLPTETQIEACGRVDVLLALAGAGPTLALPDLLTFVEAVQAKIVIPMHYGVPGFTMQIAPVRGISESMAGRSRARRFEL